MTRLAEAALVEGFRPGYLGRIAQMHGEYYSKTWKLTNMGLEAMTARELADFATIYQPTRDLLFTAHVDGLLVGSIAMDGSGGGQVARLRWYLVDEAHHGHGIGSGLMRRAFDFCRKQGYQKIYLWPVESLPESRQLYERAGFRMVERRADSLYTAELINLRMEMELR